ncbi:MAG: D-alanyl-D-alanine carboxypeptidase family protein [Oscillospiraceae bacterium]|nr:D-alanyl-D-alanine carboxypeptidase family protein [Oscillospiraceae bacterium]
MRRAVSAVTYLLVGFSVILIILIVYINFKAQIFDKLPIGEIIKEPTKTTLDEPTDPPTSEPLPEDNSPTYPVPSGSSNVSVAEAVIYSGPTELPVSGATGFASVDMDIYDSLYETIGELKAGQGFRIIKEDGLWWQIYLKSKTDGSDIFGWVRHNLCMINLPDVIPSVIYENTNAYGSVFRANGDMIPNITGERLYSYSDRKDGKEYNERLGRYEYIVPVLYAMAERICAAQANALENGDTLIIYEGFRPYETQQSVYNEVTRLPASQKNFGSWGQSWFIAYGKSNHQMGYAIDTSLGAVLEKEYLVSGKYKYPKLQYFEYTMPTAIHELSVNAALYASSGSRTYSEGVKNNIHAQNLQYYCSLAGLSSLASEWWHFNDEYAHAGITKESSGDFFVTECYSISPSN